MARRNRSAFALSQDMEGLGVVRVIRIQQVSCRLLCLARLPDRLSQGALSRGVHGRLDGERGMPQKNLSEIGAMV